MDSVIDLSPNSRTKTSGIYAIHSSINGRTYIGHSSDIRRRWIDHRKGLRRGNHDNPHLQNAWDKYGEEAFEFVVLEECAVEKLLEREQYHLDQYPDNYNCALIAKSMLGYKHTAETRAKISAARKGSKASPETRAKISKSLIGNTRGNPSPETLENLHRSNIGSKRSPETKARISTALKGRKHSDETKAKISVARKAYCERKRAEGDE
jgi:group I intron endonuclease